ncbi:ATP-binding cassette transporter [Dendrothele bispora CBS 962.96]|uniref:ATP-binding cassette transporter n=1 Tax=Dendrothele bispora (strain CBS 962.96) TaxID=1314807 RepID=A0A4S8LR23_DENBC|nr:ATP-binding cassette transporter [Dendrothele bispora CBS 962.96]
MIPAYAAIASVVLLFVQSIAFFVRQKSRASRANKSASVTTIHNLTSSIVQLLLLILLVVLSFESSRKCYPSSASIIPKYISCLVLVCLLLIFDVASSNLCIKTYLTFLRLFTLRSGSDLSKFAWYHCELLLLIILAVCVYRDLYPLSTYTKIPQDLCEGWLLWVKVSALVLASVVVPLTTPRDHRPVDPNITSKLNPEQTASWASLVFYSFLDNVILRAYRSPQLGLEDLPPLADYDDAKNLKAGSFPYLDAFSSANKTRHIFFGLVTVFRWDYFILAVMSIVEIASSFASPIGINRLLNFIEQGSQDVDMRPWFWILMLFLGSVLRTLAAQWYEFTATRIVVHAEAILTQLIFEHSLRIRPTDEAQDDLKNAHTDSGTEQTQTSSHQANLVGKINNLVTTDLANVVAARDFLNFVVKIPIQIALCVVFLYIILGWSAFVGLAAILLCFPIPGWVGKRVHGVQAELMKKTDSRVTSVVEAMNLLRMIKLFGWERKMTEKVDDKREQELTWLWKRELMDLMINCVNFVIPVFTLLATYFTYTVIMKQELTASKVFSTMTVIDMFREQLYIIFASITSTVSGKVSLDRINDFLHNTELLDTYLEEAIKPQAAPQDMLGLRQAAFSWSSKVRRQTPSLSSQSFLLKVETELLFRQGGINLIIGPTGSGKTSLLMALLGEMHYTPLSSDSWFNLPRSGGVAYAAQESWVQNDTIKGNILFGNPFDASRYRKVIHQCCLEHDLSLFEAGDLTEIGEKGITLSGGQKARITLARAVYSRAEILLLDDVLAALDVHTAKWIVDKCFKGDLIKDRTVLLVTHNVALAEPIADFVVSVGSNGCVFSRKSVKEAINKDRSLQVEAKKDKEMLERAGENIDPSAGVDPTWDKANVDQPKSGKLVIAEEKETGRVSWAAVFLYINALGGKHYIFFNACFIITMFLSNLSINGQTYFLGYWASQYDDHSPNEVNVFLYSSDRLSLILFSAVLWHVICRLVYFKGAIRASRLVHHRLVKAVFGTTLRWLDTTPMSRIISRATQDMTIVDGPLRQVLFGIWNAISFTLIKFAAVVVISPAFFLPAGVLILLGCWISQIYMKAQLAVKREMANSRSPVLAHFGAAIAGLVSIRAYSASDAFIQNSLSLINNYTVAARTYHGLTLWVTVRLDILSALFSSALAAYLVYFQSYLSSSTTGFSLNMGVGFSMLTLYLVQVLNDFEVQSNSVERIRQYTQIEQEPKPTSEGEPPAYWPASGDLRVEHLSAKYSADGPDVLHDLTFSVNSGERIGVVGRTGSGKSSLTLSLLRAILTSGDVYFDGLRTSSINLDKLRSSITIIPQVPELLSGTLRYNLDPFDQHDDATLNDALKAAGLNSLQQQQGLDSDTGGDGDSDNREEEVRLNLDTSISSGGTNLSVGQRQILALARAIVRRSKLLILDEATSAIDYKTDAIIQRSLRTELGDDVTLIAIAHRLQTIMDADRIMVLEDGRIVEYDSPKNLMKDKNSKLRALVEESDDRDGLLAMVK